MSVGDAHLWEPVNPDVREAIANGVDSAQVRAQLLDPNVVKMEIARGEKGILLRMTHAIGTLVAGNCEISRESLATLGTWYAQAIGDRMCKVAACSTCEDTGEVPGFFVGMRPCPDCPREFDDQEPEPEAWRPSGGAR